MPPVSALQLARQRKSELWEWREGKGALYRETLQTTGFYVGRIVIVPREFAPIPSAPLHRSHFRENSRFPEGVFGGMRNLSVRCGLQTAHQNLGGAPPPVGRPPGPVKRTRREEHRALLIVRDEFRPAIPRSGCSPALPVSASPALGRLPCTPQRSRRKGTFLLCTKRGHFYFALTRPPWQLRGRTKINTMVQ